MKPDWCPTEIWSRANSAVHGYSVFSDGLQIDNVATSIARALIAERWRALEEAHNACLVVISKAPVTDNALRTASVFDELLASIRALKEQV